MAPGYFLEHFPSLQSTHTLKYTTYGAMALTPPHALTGQEKPSPAQLRLPCVQWQPSSLCISQAEAATLMRYFSRQEGKTCLKKQIAFSCLSGMLCTNCSSFHISRSGVSFHQTVFPEKALEASSHFWVENAYWAHLIHEGNQLACKCRWSKQLLIIAI